MICNAMACYAMAHIASTAVTERGATASDSSGGSPSARPAAAVAASEMIDARPAQPSTWGVVM